MSMFFIWSFEYNFKAAITGLNDYQNNNNNNNNNNNKSNLI